MGRAITDENLDEVVDAMLERARNEPDDSPLIVKATYHPERGLDLFVLEISDGRRLVLPRERLQFVAGATPEQAAEFTLGFRGEHIWWPQLDEGFRLEGLLEGRTGNQTWMENLQHAAVAA
jgi:hypothetical protein